jgi:thymidylate synthase
MRIITSTCPDEALFKGLTFLVNEGLRQRSRAGDVLVMPCPVVTINAKPLQRVSFNPRRNANPFFHLMESLWMLAGRNDATWLDQFVGDFSKRFAEDDGTMHGAYGFRWRDHFDIEGGGWPPDQLNKAVEMLKANPDDRRVVIAMWDPVADLGADKKDIPCNTHVYCRVRDMSAIVTRVLDLTVCCRSNDAVMGCHGANVVQFSVLQEYLAARIGVGVGMLYQVSNNYHVYKRDFDRIWPLGLEGTERYARIVRSTALVSAPAEFDNDLSMFFGHDWLASDYANIFLSQVAVPMRRAYEMWRCGDRIRAREIVHAIEHCDWKMAAEDWFARLMHKHLQPDRVQQDKGTV